VYVYVKLKIEGEGDKERRLASEGLTLESKAWHYKQHGVINGHDKESQRKAFW